VARAKCCRIGLNAGGRRRRRRIGLLDLVHDAFRLGLPDASGLANDLYRLDLVATPQGVDRFPG
jgi:hypothetical protein